MNDFESVLNQKFQIEHILNSPFLKKVCVRMFEK